MTQPLHFFQCTGCCIKAAASVLETLEDVLFRCDGSVFLGKLCEDDSSVSLAAGLLFFTLSKYFANDPVLRNFFFCVMFSAHVQVLIDDLLADRQRLAHTLSQSIINKDSKHISRSLTFSRK